MDLHAACSVPPGAACHSRDAIASIPLALQSLHYEWLAEINQEVCKLSNFRFSILFPKVSGIERRETHDTRKKLRADFRAKVGLFAKALTS
jgi:hypothetical protein